jgi:CspA family cold shock protein
MSPLLSLIIAIVIGLAAGFLIVSTQVVSAPVIIAAFAVTAFIGALIGISSAQPRTGATAGSSSPARGDRQQGAVKWFNYSKGFGFITRDSGEDIFVHFKSIRGEGDGKRGLREGQRVEFSISEGEKGLQADDVTVIGKD